MWLYWLVEFAIVTAIPANTGYKETHKPFSEYANIWYKSFPNIVGRIPYAVGRDCAHLIDNRLYTQAVLWIMPEEKITEPPYYNVIVQFCLGSGRKDIFLSVKCLEIDPKVRMVRGRPVQTTKYYPILQKSIMEEEWQQFKTAILQVPTTPDSGEERPV